MTAAWLHNHKVVLACHACLSVLGVIEPWRMQKCVAYAIFSSTCPKPSELFVTQVPFTSANAKLEQLLGNKRRIVALNKADLADPGSSKV